jgi:hypothetical protein
MIASLRPEEAIEMWDWLIDNGHFSPLTNVESLMFKPDSGCGSDALAWNQLKGSWNLSLQTLGWGIYLTSRDGQIPILWQATTSNPLLQRGYNVLAPDQSPQITSPTPSSNSTSSIYERECEYPDEYTIGQMIWRSNASGTKVHGQFGTLGSSPYPAQSGYVKYTGIRLPKSDQLILKLRYSKYSSSSVPILIFLDDEPTPRASFYPTDLGNWDRFAWTEPILLGDVAAGDHSLIFSTEGQQYGVADLDVFIIE